MAANDADGGNIDTAIGVVQMPGGERRVCLKYYRPVTEILFEAQNAFEIGEALARAAYEARYGKALPGNQSNIAYLAQQVKARVTQDMRNQLVEKASFDIRSMLGQGRDPNHIAQQTVDNILAAVA